MRLVFDPEALENLEDIYAHSLAMWGAGQAERYRSRLFTALGSLVDHPELGRPLAGNPLEIRVLLIDRHNVF